VAFTPRFFPYHPRRIRIAMFSAALIALAMAAFTAAHAHRPHTTLTMARTGVYLGLTVAFLVPFMRLRPREAWGVDVGERELIIARPFSGQPIAIPWEHVGHVRRTQKGTTILVVLDPPPGRVLVARHLFANAREFEALCEALEAIKPAPQLDA
jgi:hypothetical protein